MATGTTHKNWLLGRIIGGLLVLIGIGFVALLAILVLARELSPREDLRVSLFMFGFGTVLIWIGSTFLRPESEVSQNAKRWHNFGFDSFLIRCRPVVELLAGTGCGLMVAHVIALCVGANWPPATFYLILVGAPIGIGLLTLTILVPRAFQSGLFANEVWTRWSRQRQFLTRTILRLGWTGYFAVAISILGLSQHIQVHWRPLADILTSSFIVLLYVSQILALHFGRVRPLS